MEKNIIAGIDIGCSGVRCVIAIEDENSALEIAGVGICPCSGHIRQGVLVNASIAGAAIQRAVEEAEQTCGLEIESVFINITGLHVRGMLASATLQIGEGKSDYPEEISEEHIKSVEESAGNITLPSGCEVLERTVRDYSFGGFSQLPDPPVGLKSGSVQARVYTIYADRIAAENLRSVVQNAGIAVEAVIPSAVASAAAVLNSDEKQVGTVVVDIGSANTDLVIYYGGSPIHLSSFSMGGNKITSDIQSLGISWNDAEKLKTEKVAAANQFAEKSTLSVRKVGGRGAVSVALPVLTQIAAQRIEEIFNFVAEEIAASGIGVANLTGGIVLTGGAARMAGIIDAATGITGHQVEPGIPRAVKSASKLANTPEMATAIGLVKHGLELRQIDTGEKEHLGYKDFTKRVSNFFNKLK
ncbi:MAG: cell division protein FtsA [Candidatus Fermentibacteria bacterium]|nr:cell division protein FtsA [Candidatus Fermentibacteria bacterium]